MPFVPIDRPDILAPLDTPKGFAVTPGESDINQGGEAPDFLSGAAAIFRRGNPLTSWAVAEDRYSSPEEEGGFDPWKGIEGTKYQRHWRRFPEVRNTRALENMKRKIDREIEDKRMEDAMPWWQALPVQIAAGALDPGVWMPAGAYVRSVRGGYSIAATAGMTAGGGALQTAIQEAGLHSSQETRTLGESVVNVGAATLLTGLLGAGGAKLLNRAEWRDSVAALARQLNGPEPSPLSISDEVTRGAPAPAGAQVVAPASVADNAIAGRAASAVAAATESLNPALRLLQSPSAAVRETGTNLFENSLYLKKNADGIASEPAVETLMKEWNGGLGRALSATEEAFAEYRKAGGSMTSRQFREAVGQAMRRNDDAAEPAVAKVAKEWRAKVFDPLKEAAIKAKLLPADVSVDTAMTYFSRMWNQNKLRAREGEFKAIVRRWVTQNAPGWAAAYDKKTERSLNPLRQELADIEMAKLRRAEELRRREQDGEVDLEGIDEATIRNAMRIVSGGAPRPKVNTLTQFVAKAGGLVDFGGELAHRGINNKARPGFIRKERRRAQNASGGWSLDDMARHAFEAGYFPDHLDRPSIDEFIDALTDDFFKIRAVLPRADKDAYRLQELIDRLDQDLARLGINDVKGTRFATSAEMKDMVRRVYAALDAEADRKTEAIKRKLVEREGMARVERDARFLGEPDELARQIADEVFDSLTGKTTDSLRPGLITIKARGPLKERTFHIPDELVEDFLENDVEMVGRRYTRVMGADVELARKFGSVDLDEQLAKIREDYHAMREGVTDEKRLKQLNDAEERDVTDIESLRDLLRGQTLYNHAVERKFDRIVRAFNHVNYIRSMGEVVLASLTDAVRPAMVHGLRQFMATLPQLATNMSAIKMSVAEAKLAGNVMERVLGHRLATVSELIDPYASRGPVESFLENMSNVASRWNGIRIWTDGMKAMASVMTQNRILDDVARFASVSPKEKRYLAYLGIDESMADRIARQFSDHGKTMDGVRVANTDKWTDPFAVRVYRAAMNKDVDSIIVQRSVADVPLFASTPTGKALLQFKSFALASHQRVLLRGLQEDQSRFISGMLAMTAMGMLITYLKAYSGNRDETREKALKQPGWWVGEGLDRSGVLSVPMELSNIFEKATGLNPIKSPMRILDDAGGVSQRMQNRSLIGALAGPSAGLIDDTATVAGIPRQIIKGEAVTRGQKNAAERLIPFNSYLGMRQMMRYFLNPQD